MAYSVGERAKSGASLRQLKNNEAKSKGKQKITNKINCRHVCVCVCV